MSRLTSLAQILRGLALQRYSLERRSNRIVCVQVNYPHFGKVYRVWLACLSPPSALYCLPFSFGCCYNFRMLSPLRSEYTSVSYSACNLFNVSISTGPHPGSWNPPPCNVSYPNIFEIPLFRRSPRSILTSTVRVTVYWIFKM